MVFLPTVNRRRIKLYQSTKRLSLLIQRKLQNSPSSIDKHSFMAEILLFVMRLSIYGVKRSKINLFTVCNFSTTQAYSSLPAEVSMRQNETFHLPKQLDNNQIDGETRKSILYLKKSLTRTFAVHWSFSNDDGVGGDNTL